MDYMIVGGDSKQLLLPQLADIGRAKPEARPLFGVKVCLPSEMYVGDRKNQVLSMHVYGLTAADGSGDNWHIRAWTNHDFAGHFGPVHVELEYNTNRRTGTLDVTRAPEPFKHC